jgi:hypothetical protein
MMWHDETTHELVAPWVMCPPPPHVLFMRLLTCFKCPTSSGKDKRLQSGRRRHHATRGVHFHVALGASNHTVRAQLVWFDHRALRNCNLTLFIHIINVWMRPGTFGAINNVATLSCFPLHCIALRYILLRYILLDCITLHLYSNMFWYRFRDYSPLLKKGMLILCRRSMIYVLAQLSLRNYHRY